MRLFNELPRLTCPNVNVTSLAAAFLRNVEVVELSVCYGLFCYYRNHRTFFNQNVFNVTIELANVSFSQFYCS